MGYSIEKLNHDDLDKAIELARIVTIKSATRYIYEKAIDYVKSGECDKQIEFNEDYIYLLRFNNLIIGLAIVENNNISNLLIDNEYQDIGAGSTFVYHLLRNLFNNYQRVQASCFAKNKVANNFYLRNGFSYNNEQYNKLMDEQFRYYSIDNPNVLQN